MRLALGQGAYTARSIAANAQRCVNLYAEPNPPDAPFPTTHYPVPGLILKGTAPNNLPYRCLYRTKSTGELFSVNGTAVYQISSGFAFTQVGTMLSNSGIVSMADNGFEMLIVDGTANGYHVDLTTKAFTNVTDPNFYGGNRVDVVDTYFVLNRPGTQNWYISLTNEAVFNALDIASKTSSSDKLKSVLTISDNLLLLGELTTELWYNSGASDFTFQKLAGVFIEHGLHATYSLAKYESSAFWLSQNEQGQRIVLRYAGMQTERVSTYAIEAEFSSYATASDAVAFCYQMGGHVFYQISFPSANTTWVWDDAAKLWHERVSLDGNGNWNRHIAHVGAYCFGLNLCGDYSNGNLYAFDLNTYTDNGATVLRLRSFPHLQDEGRLVSYRTFIADMQSGEGNAANPIASLRWSDDRGKTWGDAVQLPIGAIGNYDSAIQWWGLGIGRHRVFELSWADDVKTALNGAWVETSS